MGRLGAVRRAARSAPPGLPPVAQIPGSLLGTELWGRGGSGEGGAESPGGVAPAPAGACGRM